MAGSSMPVTADFDANAALSRAREIQNARCELRYRQRTSRLDRYQTEIRAMVALGATARTIQIHLETAHGLRVSLTTVSRWMQKHLGDRNEKSSS